MPWAGNMSKTMSPNGKQVTVTREFLTAVARDQGVQLKVAWCCRWNLSAFFKICFCFVVDLRFSRYKIRSFAWNHQSNIYSTVHSTDENASVHYQLVACCTRCERSSILYRFNKLTSVFLCVCPVLYNPSYSCILIGSCLWSVRGQTHDWRRFIIQRFFPLCFKMAERF